MKRRARSRLVAGKPESPRGQRLAEPRESVRAHAVQFREVGSSGGRKLLQPTIAGAR